MEFLAQHRTLPGGPETKAPTRHPDPRVLAPFHSRLSRRALLLVVAVLLEVTFFGVPLRGQGFKEYDLKAVFLYHLAQFVEWPKDAFPAAETPLVIGVLGADPFGKALDEVVQNEVLGNRKLAVQRYRTVAEIGTCHILFISKSEGGRMDQIFSSLRGRNILTVGDTDGFARQGGVVRFMTVQNRIKLKIYLDSARAANLTISSKLLRAAEVISDKDGKP